MGQVAHGKSARWNVRDRPWIAAEESVQISRDWLQDFHHPVKWRGGKVLVTVQTHQRYEEWDVILSECVKFCPARILLYT